MVPVQTSPTQSTLHIVSSRMRYSNGRWFVMHQVFSDTARLGIFKNLAEAKRFVKGQVL